LRLSQQSGKQRVRLQRRLQLTHVTDAVQRMHALRIPGKVRQGKEREKKKRVSAEEQKQGK
jgi:hypothetical protein